MHKIYNQWSALIAWETSPSRFPRKCNLCLGLSSISKSQNFVYKNYVLSLTFLRHGLLWTGLIIRFLMVCVELKKALNFSIFTDPTNFGEAQSSADLIHNRYSWIPKVFHEGPLLFDSMIWWSFAWAETKMGAFEASWKGKNVTTWSVCKTWPLPIAIVVRSGQWWPGQWFWSFSSRTLYDRSAQWKLIPDFGTISPWFGACTKFGWICESWRQCITSYAPKGRIVERGEPKMYRFVFCGP